MKYIRKVNLKRWDIFYISNKYFKPLSENEIEKIRPCIVIGNSGANLIAIELTSIENKYHMPLTSSVGKNPVKVFAKMSYVFTINLFDLKDKIRSYGERINLEDRNNISKYINFTSYYNNDFKEKEN